MAERQPETAGTQAGELLELLVEHVRDCAIFVVDPQGRVTNWNPGAARLLGYREDEILGQSADVFFTPEDIETGRPQRELQEAVEGAREHADRWYVRQDGGRFWGGGVTAPLWDSDRKLRGFARIVRDRTEWKRAEEQRANDFKVSERRQRLYDAALTNTPDLVYVFDLDHRFIYVNDGLLRMWGRTWEEAIGRNCLELGYEPWHAAMHDREIEQVVATRQPIKGEVPFTGTFGRRIYEYIFVPVLGENGEVEAVAGTTRDVTDRRQAEEQVRQSEQRFRNLMEQAPISIQVLSPDGRTLRVNGAWEELWGFTLEQLGDYSVLDDPQLAAKGILPYLQRAFGGEAVEIPAIEYDPDETLPDRTRHADPKRWVSAVAYPLKDESGSIQEVVLIHQDITARRRAEQDRQVFAFLVENSRDFIGICDTNLMPFFVNREGLKLVGLADLEQAIQTPVLEFFFPEDQPYMAEQFFPRALQDGYGEVEIRFRHFQTGQPIWMTYSVVAVLDGDGQRVGLATVSRDISARKQAEQELQRSERQSRTILESIADAFYAVDRQWNFTYVNRQAERLLRRNRDELLGRNIWVEYPPATAPEFYEAYHRAAAENATVRFETFYAPHDRWYEVDAYPSPEGVSVYFRDVSERKRAEEALRDADRRKDEFLATLAHELRNPLAPIHNALQILKMPRVDAAIMQQTREMIERQVHHLVRLVDDLLDVSRVMRGKVELRREPVELGSIIARAVETVQPLIDLQGHRLEIAMLSDSLLMDADPVRLAQVVGNLLTNSAKYTEPNGRIWLSAWPEAGMAVLRVRDSGIGIAPEMLPQIFDLFVQVDHTATRSQGGLGIGLTLVKNLVEMHGGTVEARSDGLGQGSEFVVRLPLLASEPQVAAESEREQPHPPARASGKRLLVVDDNRDAALSFALLLQLQGHDVRVTHDGDSALAMAASFRPHLVFLDIGMPLMDGYEVARRMRRQPGLENVVLVALTGWGQEEDRRRTAEAGFNHHLVKPPEAQAVERIVGELGPG